MMELMKWLVVRSQQHKLLSVFSVFLSTDIHVADPMGGVAIKIGYFFET